MRVERKGGTGGVKPGNLHRSSASPKPLPLSDVFTPLHVSMMVGRLSAEELQAAADAINKGMEGKAREISRCVQSYARENPDLLVRDLIFENWPDQRSIAEMLAEKWWPSVPRVFVQKLQINEKKRVVRELDNFFRWRQRCADFPEHTASDRLFLRAPLPPKRLYERLSRLCHALDIVLPGDASLPALRTRQREVYRSAYPMVARPAQTDLRIPEVEKLLDLARHPRTGLPLSKATLAAQRRALNLHHRVLQEAGLPFGFNRPALDRFADHAFSRLDVWIAAHERADTRQADEEKEKGWCRRSVKSMCARLVPHIEDKALRKQWLRFAHTFDKDARKRGDLKSKERSLSERPVGLNGLFQTSVTILRSLPEQTNLQSRQSRAAVLGALGILLFYPLRVSDLLRLRLHRELVRHEGQWLLNLGHTQKTGSDSPPLILPSEATPLLDAGLLRGYPRFALPGAYEVAVGAFFLKSPKGDHAYNASAFSTAFSRHVGHSPHLLRTVWCDELVGRGADRTTISAMLQHKSIISQEEYEVLARKIRRNRAVDALRLISERLLQNHSRA